MGLGRRKEKRERNGWGKIKEGAPIHGLGVTIPGVRPADPLGGTGGRRGRAGLGSTKFSKNTCPLGSGVWKRGEIKGKGVKTEPLHRGGDQWAGIGPKNKKKKCLEA